MNIPRSFPWIRGLRRAQDLTTLSWLGSLGMAPGAGRQRRGRRKTAAVRTSITTAASVTVSSVEAAKGAVAEPLSLDEEQQLTDVYRFESALSLRYERHRREKSARARTLGTALMMADSAVCVAVFMCLHNCSSSNLDVVSFSSVLAWPWSANPGERCDKCVVGDVFSLVVFFAVLCVATACCVAVERRARGRAGISFVRHVNQTLSAFNLSFDPGCGKLILQDSWDGGKT
jgi:hypothetical protein